MKNMSHITNIIGIALILGYVIFLAVMWKNIPDTVPKHFNAAGEADAYGSKMLLIIEPVFMVLMFLIFTVVEHHTEVWNFPVNKTGENKDRLNGVGTFMLASIKILVLCFFLVAGFSSIFAGFPVWPLYVLLALTAVVIIGGLAACIRAR